jgi:glutathione S-transferase
MLANLLPLVVFLTVLVLLWTAVNVGRARGKTGVKAPATTGHPDFERAFRVQMNTLEGAVMFLPALWLCASYFPSVAGVTGLAWIVGRVFFALGYYQAPEKRAVGFLISMAALGVLLAGGGFGVLRALVGA